MALVVLVAVIFLVAVLLAWVTKINLAYLFAPAIFLISIWGFFFGLLGNLNLAMETLVVFVGLILIILSVKSNGFRSQLIKSSYAPSTIAFVSLSLISLYKSKDWVLSQWDEFSHWGVVVKAMHEYSALGPETPVELWAGNYPPGISLFQYFVMDFSAEWREGLLFWATQLIVISIIVSVLAKSSYKYLSEIALKLFIALAASSVFFNNFDNIYADPTLALAFGFLLFVAIQASHLYGRWALVLALTAGFVTLIKPVGIYFATTAILVNIVATLFTLKFHSIKKFILAFVPALVSLVTVGAVWITWHNYANSFGNSIVDPIGTLPNGLNNLTNQNAVVSNYIGAFFETYINPSYSNSLSSVYWTILCVVFFVIWALLNGSQNKKQNIAIGVTLLITTVGYFGLILFSYLTVFGPGEAVNLASYGRYIGTWYQGLLVAMMFLILSELSFNRLFDSDDSDRAFNEPVNLRRHVSLYLVAFLTLISFSSIMNYIILLRTDQFKGSQYRAPFEPVKKAIGAAEIPKGSKVWIIAQHTEGFEYYVLRYEMINAKFGTVSWSIGSPDGDGDIWTDSAQTAQTWSQELRNFDYVVLYSASEGFYTEFGSIFESGIIDTNSVYKVIENDGTVSLSKVN
jgi:hypothetical protein